MVSGFVTQMRNSWSFNSNVARMPPANGLAVGAGVGTALGAAVGTGVAVGDGAAQPETNVIVRMKSATRITERRLCMNCILS